MGTTLNDKWRLDVLLGVGGMASVYAATHRNGTRAAVKLLHSEFLINAQVRARFLREGHLANAVGHDGVVKVIDDDTARDGSLFLVTELLDGETLEDRLRRLGGTLSEDEVLSVVDQLLGVLVAAHARGVVHRDLKPENVFLTRDGIVKVLDFGIAHLRALSTASTATKGGETMGTPAFMPPEQARGLWEHVDARSDVWAVGATMYYLLSGKLVHGGRTPNEQLLEAMTKPAPSLASAGSGASPAVARVVDRALAYEPADRWPDAEQMRDAVRNAYHDRYGAALSSAPAPTIPETVVNRTLPPPTAGLQIQEDWTSGRLNTGGDAAAAPRKLVIWGGAGLLIVGVLAAGAAAMTSAKDETTTVSAAQSSGAPSSQTQGSSSRASGPASSVASSRPSPALPALPVVAVSDLPRAAMVPPSGLPSQKLVSPPPPQSIALSAPGPGQTGKLNVGASEGWCIVTIDGVARGETPVAGIELSAGPHEVSCAPAEGKVKTATVVIQKDGTTRYRFALEE